MSDKRPPSGSVDLDSSEGEVETAKRVWVKKVLDIDTPRRGGPTIGLQRDPEVQFNRAVKVSMDALGAARGTPAVDDVTENAKGDLEAAMSRMVGAGNTKDFGAAMTALDEARKAGDTVQTGYIAARDGWPAALDAVTRALPPLLSRLQALPPGQVEAQAAHDTAQKAATEAEAAGDKEDYRAAMKLLATAREATAKLSELLAAAERLANEKAAYESKLSTTQAALDAGQQAKSASDAADSAKTALTKAVQEMAAAVAERRYGDALHALGQAEAAAKIITDERDKAKLAFEQAYPAAEQAYGTTMGAHTSKPALNQATLDLKKTADEAKAAAEKARDEGDWSVASAGIATLIDAVTAFDVAYKAEWVVRDATALKRADLDRRITAKADLDTVNPAHLKAKATAVAALAKLDAALNGPSATASGLATTAEGAVVTLEACRPENASQKGTRTDAAAAAVALLSESAIAGLSVERRAELALDLIAKGPPAGAAKTQLRRLYDKAGMDPAFVRKQQAIQTETARKVKDIPGAADMMAHWDDPRTPSEQAAFQTQVEQFLRKAQEEQSKILKISDVPLTFFSTPATTGGGVTFGQYNPDSRNIQLNSHPDGMPSFKRALATILHENTHSHQHNRIDELKAGKIPPDDPDFGQILMFAVNNEDNGYVPGSDPDYQLYKKQPIEEDAWRQGDDGADVVIGMLNGTIVA